MAHYIFNVVPGGAPSGSSAREHAAALMRLGIWSVDAGERHRDALAPGDLALVYLGAPEREFLGRAELASAARGEDGRLTLAGVVEWAPPVPMHAVLERIGPSETARADFGAGVVRITAEEYGAALAVAEERAG